MEKIWLFAEVLLGYGGMTRVFMDGSVPCFRLLVCKTYDSLQAPCVSYGLARCCVNLGELDDLYSGLCVSLLTLKGAPQNARREHQA